MQGMASPMEQEREAVAAAGRRLAAAGLVVGTSGNLSVRTGEQVAVSPTGAVLAALEYATRATALSVGKPEPQMFLTALDRLAGVDPARALVIGDRVDADVAGAHAAGLDAALVLSGVSGHEEADAALRAERPVVAVADTLAELVLAGPGSGGGAG